MKSFTKGQLAMLAVSRSVEPCESLYSMATFKKALTIFEFAPLLNDGVIQGMYQFEAVYRGALYRKKVAKKTVLWRNRHKKFSWVPATFPKGGVK
jgi:hypothetical protein